MVINNNNTGYGSSVTGTHAGIVVRTDVLKLGQCRTSAEKVSFDQMACLALLST